MFSHFLGNAGRVNEAMGKERVSQSARGTDMIECGPKKGFMREAGYVPHTR